MTHEELLAKIDEPNYLHTILDKRRALRAVVELHKPGRTTMFTNEVVCDGCDQGDNYYSNMWPCPTIQAIEKELR